jgi:hypothetical protein
MWLSGVTADPQTLDRRLCAPQNQTGCHGKGISCPCKESNADSLAMHASHHYANKAIAAPAYC